MIEEVVLETELSAALIVAYSPDVVVPARTMIEPDGGDVLVAARTVLMESKNKGMMENFMVLWESSEGRMVRS